MKTLRAGAARAVVTPPVGYTMGAWGLRQGRSTGVHQNLYARALALDDGEKQLAIVAIDVAGFSQEVVKLIRDRVGRLTDIPSDHLLISSTHNHTTPDLISGIPPELGVYAAIFAENVAGAVAEAFNRREPARIGVGAGQLPGWTINRQYPRRAVDTSLGVMRIDSNAGRPIARVVNFACHGVCDGGQYLDWSGDFPGAMSATLEDWYPSSICIYLQGAAGDIHPFDWWFGNWKSKHLHTHEDTESFGRAIAAEAARVSEAISLHRSAALGAASTVTALPRRQVPWTVAQAEANNRKLKATLGSYHGDIWPKGTTTAIAAMMEPSLYGAGANELRLAQNKVKPAVRADVRAFRIGDLVISGSPGEMFNELGQDIKKSAGPHVWVASYCDNYIGYVSTRETYGHIEAVPLDEIVDQAKYRRYYGTTTSPFAPEAGDQLVEASAKLARKV